jgi:hypothetical protein
VLKPVTVDDFLEGDVHKAHYFFDKGENWLGVYPEGTSFDRGLWKTTKFLHGCGYDTKLYNSHMPQIVNKDICCMILDRTAGLGLDEWSTYFNIAKHLFPQYFEDTLYRAMGWPDNGARWLPASVPVDVVFMNYYKGSKTKQLSSQDKTERMIDAWTDTINDRFVIQHSVAPELLAITVFPGKLVPNFERIHCQENALLTIKMVVGTEKFLLKISYGYHNLEFDELSIPLWISIPPLTLRKGGINQLDIVLADADNKEVFTLSVPVIIE